VARSTANETTGLATSGGEATGLTVLVSTLADPVDARITADSGVVGVNHDHLKVLVGGILVDPVGVEDTKVSANLTCLTLSNGAQRTLVLQLHNTLVLGLTVDDTLGNLLLTTTTTNADAVDDVALLGLVAETVSLVGAGGASATVDTRELTVQCKDKISHVRNLHVGFISGIIVEKGS
jgi:hypothetical protein